MTDLIVRLLTRKARRDAAVRDEQIIMARVTRRVEFATRDLVDVT